MALLSGVSWITLAAGFFTIGKSLCFKSSDGADSWLVEFAFGSLHMVEGNQLVAFLNSLGFSYKDSVVSVVQIFETQY